MTVTQNDIELVVLEDIDFSLECKPHRLKCNDTATWLLVLQCGCDQPLCDLHKKVSENDISFILSRYLYYRCEQCNTEYLIDWRWEKI